jgi:hypothetical protein
MIFPRVLATAISRVTPPPFFQRTSAKSDALMIFMVQFRLSAWMRFHRHGRARIALQMGSETVP